MRDIFSFGQEAFSALGTGMYILYGLVSFVLFLYGVNSYLNLFLHLRKAKSAQAKDFVDEQNGSGFWEKAGWPRVTTQLPLYNEHNVCERLLDCIASMDYPKELHQIQVLDDSTDGSEKISQKKVAELKAKGYDIAWVHRKNRVDYKAGALREGMESATGEFLAIFDADFLPNPDFFKRLLPFFAFDEKMAMVQGRWGHLNNEKSLLTLAQSIGIDGHFAIEQTARSWNQLFLNFNGSGGIWRKKAIESAGNWQGDTLTEDLDLSYRAQLKGWKHRFVLGVEVPAEIPEDINAFKQQQYRWAKGSIQTAKKLLPLVLRTPDISILHKLEAVMHMTHYLIHPLMLFSALVSAPLLYFMPQTLGPWPFIIMLFGILLSSVAPSCLYIVAQRALYPSKWKTRLSKLPLLAGYGVGIAINNTRAVLSAVRGRHSPFVRTPKKGDHQTKVYGMKFPLLSLLELVIGFYCLFGVVYFVYGGEWLMGPFLFLYGSAFTIVAFESFLHYFRQINLVDTVE